MVETYVYLAFGQSLVGSNNVPNGQIENGKCI